MFNKLGDRKLFVVLQKKISLYKAGCCHFCPKPQVVHNSKLILVNW
ncbi:hypothetical protein A1OE_1458 [Candidatus Endolissoclinum faulkneri L2]|uniref:Uncharacterized protein n=1 Tax=Candidatus Endolissoclinum faulkneri L2 TaxID=1193729 RepID=K7YPZ9_9PROT|nr:hypothetical protein A1OE_1458 [Candidatus Endolissoclinum faulkneri L2]